MRLGETAHLLNIEQSICSEVLIRELTVSDNTFVAMLICCVCSWYQFQLTNVRKQEHLNRHIFNLVGHSWAHYAEFCNQWCLNETVKMTGLSLDKWCKIRTLQDSIRIKDQQEQRRKENSCCLEAAIQTCGTLIPREVQNVIRDPSGLMSTSTLSARR